MIYRTLTDEELIRVAESGSYTPDLCAELLRRFTAKVYPAAGFSTSDLCGNGD